MTVHAKLSPSSASRWLACAGSVALSATVPDKPSIYAAEGSLYHRVVADCVEFGLEPWDFLGQSTKIDGFDVAVTDEMAEHAQSGLDRLRDFLPASGVHIETRVNLSPWLPDQFGTADLSWRDGDEIVVWDWKYGVGVPVSPIKNPQLMLYALGVWSTIFNRVPDVKQFRLMIEQPRNAEGGGEWVVSRKNLLAFAKQAQEAAAAALAGDAPLCAGEKQCKFCPAKNICSEFASFNLALMGMKFDDLDAEEMPTLPVEITPERRGFIVQHAGMIRGWLDDLYESAITDAIAGRPTPGHKAVLGRNPPRKWVDEKKAASFLSDYVSPDKLHVTKLVTPAHAAKLIGKKLEPNMNKFTVRGDPKPTLVSEKDARPAIEPLAEKFAVLGEDD